MVRVQRREQEGELADYDSRTNESNNGDDGDDVDYVYKENDCTTEDSETTLEPEFETDGGGLAITSKIPNDFIVEDSDGSENELANSYDLDSSVAFDEEIGNRPRFEEFREETDMENPVFKTGKVFASKKLFVMAVKTYAINNRKLVRFERSNKDRVNVRCQDGCPWLLRASHKSLDPKDPTFQVKKFEDKHTCATDAKNPRMTAEWLSQKYLRIVQSDPKVSLATLEELVYKDYTMIVSRMTLWRVRQLARIKLQGTDEQQYERLGRYKEELEKQNENNTAICLMDARLFLRFYVCLEACKGGWLAGCRPIIGLDGCFLKTRYEGQLLTAISIDANDCIYPIAYAVVEAENKEAWTWFLRCLKKDLRITEENSHNYTIMSDRQKGLVPSIEAEFPISENRFCVRHMYNNFKQEHRGKGLKDALWDATRATTVARFNMHMEKIRGIDEAAHRWLAGKPPQHWSKSRFDTHSKCDILLNNLCESFNRVILDARDKGVLTMLEIIRMNLMNRFFRRRALAEKNKDENLCLRIQKKIDKLTTLSGQYWPQPTSVLKFEIRNPHDQFVVDLRERYCSCRRWQLNGIPCAHAISAIRYIREIPEDYVAHWYTIEMFAKSYSFEVDCVNGQEMWPSSVVAPLSPPMKPRKRGRPKKKKRMDLDETKKMENARKTKLSRKGVQMICRRCGTVGHNSRGCKGIGCEPRPRLQRKTMTRDGGANDQDTIQSPETQPTMQERDEVYNFVYHY